MEPSDTPESAIDIRALNYAYAAGPTVLQDLTFKVEAGETIAVVGPSGAGKTTLLMHLNGLLPEKLAGDSETASVAVNGITVRQSTAAQVRQQVGFVFQDPDDQLFCPTVREDVAFGPLNMGLDRETVLQRVESSLERVGLRGFENRGTLQLSVGERKRVCLAGVLACEPKVLVLDEPFSNLDPRSRRGLIDILREFPGAQIIATHDLDLVVELCSRVLVLDAGQIKAYGDVRNVLSDAVLMEKHGLEVPWRLRT